MDVLIDHPEIQELLGAYALDAVEPDEAEQVERHLAGCWQCQAEVASYREVAGLLAGNDSLAPGELWDRIARGLEEQPPLLQLDRFQPRPTGSAAVPTSTARTAGPGRVLAGLLAVAAVVVVGLGIQVVRLNTRANHLPSTVASHLMLNSYQAAAIQFDAQQVSFQTDSSKAVAAVILPNGTAYVDARQLPRLPADRTYQLWGNNDGTTAPVSLAVMGSDPVIQQVNVPSNVNELEITLERAGGAPAPTTPTLAQGQILR